MFVHPIYIISIFLEIMDCVRKSYQQLLGFGNPFNVFSDQFQVSDANVVTYLHKSMSTSTDMFLDVDQDQHVNNCKFNLNSYIEIHKIISFIVYPRKPYKPNTKTYPFLFCLKHMERGAWY